MIGVPPVVRPSLHLMPIYESDVTKAELRRLRGALGTSTTVAPFPDIDLLDSPHTLVADTVA
jgi:hypothetical protein